MHPRLRLPVTPVADDANVLRGETWRLTLLDAGCVRIEHDPGGQFEDRATQTFLHRDTPPVERQVRSDEHGIEVVTARLHLRWDLQRPRPGGLSVQALGGVSNYRSTWRPGSQPANLGGTCRTLDRVDGRVELDAGILSRHGIAAVDDAASLVLDAAGDPRPRVPGCYDTYVFAYGRDYGEALDVWHRLTGAQPLLPRYALGNWWSRYHAYSDEEYLALLDAFADERVPLSVAVLDMDWHEVDIDPALGSGWTGYTWNRELFPDPDRFLAAVHDRGLAVTLNVHPADGVRRHEDAYRAVATRLGHDPADGLPVAFDAGDPEFLEAYLEELHHPLEEQGVDFWWIDWQQGTVSRTPGLDPLWVLNHVHWLDAGRGGRRPLVFSRWAGLGSHRYPVGFSGDTVASWASLDFQPEFTATAANVGHGWWSHDVGGHTAGVRDDELMTRWVQHGVFSPITRLHSTRDPFSRREPWDLGVGERAIVGDALRLRHQLVPYLATMVRRATEQHRSLVAPMYHEHPWEPEAYEVPNQHTFGTQLLVAPITSPMDEEAMVGRARAWLPPGDWVDLMTGVAYGGDRTIGLHRWLEHVPVLLRAGGILPLVPADEVTNDVGIPTALEVVLAPGADGAFTLLEDRDDGRLAATTIRWDQQRRRLSIDPPTGATDVVPSTRVWSVRLLGFGTVEGVSVTVAGEDRDVALRASDPATGALGVPVGEVPADADVVVAVDGDATPSTSDVDGRLFRLLDRARVDRVVKRRAWDRLRRRDGDAAGAAQLSSLGLPAVLADALAEVLLARQG